VLGMIGYEDQTLKSFHKNQLLKTLQQNGEKKAVEQISILIGNSQYDNF
jgi:hypothetical protein